MSASVEELSNSDDQANLKHLLSGITKNSHTLIQFFNSLIAYKISETKIIDLKLCKAYVFMLVRFIQTTRVMSAETPQS